ncbi:hypothetical protein C943_01046 [Mariniradius saccharolyticus AK6]|uniref:Uncharacterized protein n=1 Tax=Mariniradius saccharolyticus AK6 TaxID=1239962 RepID=M7XDR1_9BACT|nr:hypothetical protein C943_01046 [Mariniradius saccharolyticus AK6]
MGIGITNPEKQKGGIANPTQPGACLPTIAGLNFGMLEFQMPTGFHSPRF